MRTAIAIAVGAILALAAAAWVTRDTWRAWLAGPQQPAADSGAKEAAHPHAEKARVHLSPQAQASLKLDVRLIRLQTYWRTIQVPGTVVEKRGRSERGVTAPLAGVVKDVLAFPGDTVRPDDRLFVLRLNSEYLQSSQTELIKTVQELTAASEKYKRLEKVALSGGIAEAQLIEAKVQTDRLTATRKAHRNDLALRGLTTEQIDRVESGEFVKEISVHVPAGKGEAAAGQGKGGAEGVTVYELEELSVRPGEQVQAGQQLALLGDHQRLFIEGRGFKEEANLIERAAGEGWPLAVTFASEPEESWPPLKQEFVIRHVANAFDPASQTFPFYIPLANQYREYTRDGKTYRLWRFRPGRRVRLGVPVQQFDQVFVLPSGAVVRDGAESYVFRQNGEDFDRVAVQVLFQDARNVVVANDGSINPRNYLAHASAAVLNRALKAQQAGEGGGGHAGHSH